MKDIDNVNVVVKFADDEDKKTRSICVDFDGVIADASVPYPDIGNLVEGAEKGLQWLHNQGWEIIIFTCREEDDKLRDFLEEHDIPYDHINTQPGRDHPKPFADVYLDDKAIQFEGDWGSTVEDIEEFCPWHKKKAVKLVYKIKETRHLSCKTCKEPIFRDRPIQYLGGWYHLDCLMPPKEASFNPTLRLAAEDSFNPSNNNESELEDDDDTSLSNDTNQKDHKDRRKNLYSKDDINEVWPGGGQDEYPREDKYVHRPSKIYN